MPGIQHLFEEAKIEKMILMGLWLLRVQVPILELELA